MIFKSQVNRALDFLEEAERLCRPQGSGLPDRNERELIRRQIENARICLDESAQARNKRHNSAARARRSARRRSPHP